MGAARRQPRHESEEIAGEILYGRDLSKKGPEPRQREYAERTADKAIEQAERQGARGPATPTSAPAEQERGGHRGPRDAGERGGDKDRDHGIER